ncbi:SPFH domain-containing protein [Lysobacter solisilvae (ex Woo and Kim 2020)]|uniref:SPFH domain-containing protein n=1 Tax=Agrilutibacter terrestris TaxID=2865112 RepID=A0A7H0G039_9GAMM|nr:SPFH domain-containing protein [Lysobacter terrestris]QNP41655.1 SPFH domain-containing protein [Lysobacter terrestris]
MFGLRYAKATPSTYVIQYRNGQPVREGTGLAFFYFAPNASLVSVPLESVDVPFMFNEVSSDFQQVTVQGQVTYRVADPKLLASLMNFSLKPNSEYVSEDPSRLPQRVVNAVQVQLRAVLSGRSLQELLRGSEQLVQTVREGLRRPDGLASLGLELVNLAVLAVRPNPETARALEATVREQILKQADDATYLRRNSAIEQERAIKENELNTEIAVETKKRQIRETQLEAERAALEKRQQIQHQDMAGRIELEDRNKALTALRVENAQKESDAKAYAVAAVMKAVHGIDPKVLQALTVGNADPGALIAMAFQGLAENAQRIGELNITPDLLQQLTSKGPAQARG